MNDPSHPNVTESRAGSITLHVFGKTDVGQIREHNEDNFLVADLTRQTRTLLEADRTQVVGRHGTALGVCDGMGGAAAGEVASQLAIDIMYERLCEGSPPDRHDDLARRVIQAVEEAGTRIFNEARVDRSRRGMGTTVTLAALMDSRLFLAQVGDSRAYVLRNGQLVQVTRDQSLVTQLIEAGQLTEEEAETFEHNNIILQALGTAETVQVDLTFVDLRQKDRLLLCSDGLSGMVRSDEIRQVLLECPDPFQACKQLTDRANAAGGHDNITVIVADFDGDGLEPAGIADDGVRYQKYALPDLPEDQGSATMRAGPTATPVAVETAPMSEEAQRESRDLRVAHTMIGSLRQEPTLGAAHESRSSSNPPPATPYNSADDPVTLPISGPPPLVVGILVVGAMALAALAGFMLLN